MVTILMYDDEYDNCDVYDDNQEDDDQDDDRDDEPPQ